MRKYEIRNKDDIKLHNIVFAYTSSRDYSMERILLLDDMSDTNWDEYVLVEGYHCSCHDFDDCTWEATAYTEKELHKLLEYVPAYDEGKQKLKIFFDNY